MKKISLKIIPLLTILGSLAGVAACSGQPLINGSGSSFPFTAHVMSIHHPTPDAQGDFPDLTTPNGREFTTDLGFDIVLEEATLSWQHLDLISGGNDPECEAGFDAHLELDGTEDLIGEDLVPLHLGDFAIEDRHYCQWEVTIGDIYLRGAWESGGANGSFTIESIEEVVKKAPFKAKVADVEEEHPIHFHDGETDLEIIFGIQYDQLLDGIDFEVDSDAVIEAQVLSNLESLVHQHLGAHI